jgi:hypothetical protein
MLVKIYGSDPEGEKRYISVRVTNRRFTRLTNVFPTPRTVNALPPEIKPV